MEVNISVQLREKVAAYINRDSRRKTVDDGIDLLHQTGYKPNVYENFLKNKFRRDIPQKIDRVLRDYLRYPINPNDPDHDDIENEIPSEVNVNIEKVTAEIDQDFANKEYPDVVKRVLTEYSDLYKQRSILHKELKEIGETNSEDAVARRKTIAASILGVSHRMEELWKSYSAYKDSGIVPSDDLFNKPFDPDNPSSPVETKKQDTGITLADDIEGLKKQKENWRIKIAKAENKLLYQSEKKLAKENPMPKGPKRITLEKKIERMKVEKEQIEYAIAEQS
ncbi:MAG: hypothetical protein A2W86_11775 [Bacteroidetes bacterium GWD2_45_23]|nr:MAG: hypothetical protein A2W87_08240 [Bacteroidetes bacterium GWC2_46_850]OFX70121.1 MAG: hypothetical protein A2071_04550 [Bacteroidetes bacterium GWC1_47_7]OFX85500.1 MAG: hypothetical protein A2W86_11775 [Bacteroidetes bacterium GWD2_45_23]HBB00724.1 hypothetical protein [Porphyromonadaceae bacterium]HCC19349.1 hypothetical protein [Porphyromonadaceae bacterium]